MSLPELPEPLVMVNRYGQGASTSDGDGGVFTADQMRTYAADAVAAAVARERDRINGLMNRHGCPDVKTLEYIDSYRYLNDRGEP